MKEYQVFGGQYEQYWYGESDSLRGAKQIASQNREYWDNWQLWHTPDIYSKDDVCEIESHGNVTHRDGEIIRVHNPQAYPVAYCVSGKWIEKREEK